MLAKRARLEGVKKKIHRTKEKKKGELTVGRHGLAVRWPNAEHNSNQQILETTQQEQHRILNTVNILLRRVIIWWSIPGLMSDNHKQTTLEQRLDQDLSNERCQNLFGDKVGGRTFGVEDGEGFGAAHKDGNGENEDKVDIEELEIAQVGGKGVEEGNCCELDDTVQGHVLEATETRHQRSSSLPISSY